MGARSVKDASAATRAGPRWLAFYVIVVSAFLLAPIVIAVILSFSSVEQLAFPPPGFSLRWYLAAWENDKFMTGFAVSALIATISSLLAGVAGTLAAVALNNYRFAGRAAMRALIVIPLVVPTIVIGLGLLQGFARLEVGPGVLAASLGHAVIGLPYVTYLVLAAMSNYDVRLEDASVTLGASRLTTFFRVTLPLIRPGIIAGIAFAFLMSFDQVSISLFLTRGDPLPLRLMQHIQYNADPSVAAVSTVLVIASLVVMVIAGRTLQQRDVGNLRGSR